MCGVSVSQRWRRRWTERGTSGPGGNDQQAVGRGSLLFHTSCLMPLVAKGCIESVPELCKQKRYLRLRSSPLCLVLDDRTHRMYVHSNIDKPRTNMRQKTPVLASPIRTTCSRSHPDVNRCRCDCLVVAPPHPFIIAPSGLRCSSGWGITSSRPCATPEEWVWRFACSAVFCMALSFGMPPSGTSYIGRSTSAYLGS